MNNKSIEYLENLKKILIANNNNDFIEEINGIIKSDNEPEGLNRLFDLCKRKDFIKLNIKMPETMNMQWTEYLQNISENIQKDILPPDFMIKVKKKPIEDCEIDFAPFNNVNMNLIPIDILNLALAIVKHPKFKGSLMVEEKGIKFINNVESFCNITDDLNDLTITIVNSDSPKYKTNGKQIFSNTTYNMTYLNPATTCIGCKHSRCLKKVLGYLYYLKINGTLEDKLQELDTSKNIYNNYFEFKWDMPDGLKYIPEEEYLLVEEFVSRNLIDIRRFLNDGFISIYSPFPCSELKFMTSKKFFDESAIKPPKEWLSIKRKNTSTVESLCTKRSCRKFYCPIVAAAYMLYLDKTGQKQKIIDDRKYYKEHEKEILERYEQNNKKIIEKEKESMQKDSEKYMENLSRFNTRIINIDKLIDAFKRKNLKNLYCIIEGEPGLGQSEIINNIAEYLRNQNKLKKEKRYWKDGIEKEFDMKEISLSALSSELVVPITISKTTYCQHKENILEPCVLYVINGIGEFVREFSRYKDMSLCRSDYELTRSKQFKKTLELLSNISENTYIIITGEKKDIDLLMELDSKINYIYNEFKLSIESMTIEELFKEYINGLEPLLFDEILKNKNYYENNFVDFISNNRSLLPFKNLELANYLSMYSNSRNEIIFPPSAYKKQCLDDALKDIIGMDEVKRTIKEFESYVTFNNKAKACGMKIDAQNMHMIFSGNPGTGKTTIARIMAKMLFDIGVLKENKLIEVDRKDLVAPYVGQTAPKTAEVIQKAMGGVLFIDEAYTLIPKHDGDFGYEAIATLIKAMEDYKDELVVIFAGYNNEMNKFIEVNPGIKSRIGYTFRFQDYNEYELVNIFKVKMKKYGFKIKDDIDSKLISIMKYFCEVEDFGNGRFVDKVIQETLMNHSKRENSDISIIDSNDIPDVVSMLKVFFGGDKMINPELITEDSIRKTAYHEIGHAFLRYKLLKNQNIKKITINPSGGGALGFVRYAEDNSYTQSKADLIKRITILVGGIASEEVFLGEFHNGGTSDLEKATNICKLMITQFGMSSLGLATISGNNNFLNAEIYKETNKILQECFSDAKKILSENKEIIDRIVADLIVKKEMTEEDMLRIIKEN